VSDAPETVQSGFPLVLARVCRSPTIHFHTLFNKTVEKFNGTFIFPGRRNGAMEKQLHRETGEKYFREFTMSLENFPQACYIAAAKFWIPS
jgi:hypothetical protein